MKYLGTFKVMGNGVMGDGFTFTSKRTAIKTMRKIAVGNATPTNNVVVEVSNADNVVYRAMIAKSGYTILM